ncbi:hypothetical protein Pan189_19670 [Stratiformator vulcanicus]|uniref:Uncharacterized protein n=1 Tax=Stratiformator vulcanicus TaxID=2527980 RepID=A0A517R117_9PLAN|nr:hypothetical protein Pan189_19670 [Stratiformator vulcanicus]
MLALLPESEPIFWRINFRSQNQVNSFHVEHSSRRIPLDAIHEALLGFGTRPSLKASAVFGVLDGTLPQSVTDPRTHFAEECPGPRLDHPPAQVSPQAGRDAF